MALINWDVSVYGVNVKKIDDQHHKLVDFINELQDALSAGKGKDIVGKVLDGLAQYTVMHFGTEEELMKVHKYPEAVAHKAMHDDLVKKVVDLQSKFKSGNVFISTEVMSFLQNWLVQHIQNVDKKFGKFLNENKVT